MNNRYVIGIDLGGTKISGIVADKKGQILKKIVIRTLAYEGENEVLNRIYGLIDSLLVESNIGIEVIDYIGICSAGRIDVKMGIIKYAANLPFRNFNLVDKVSSKYGVKIYLENDANAAAIGEYMLGAGKGYDSIIYITLSTGIGSGAILNGRLYRGKTYNALEVGHITMVNEGPLCKCGNRGCSQTLASGTAIGAIAHEKLEKGERSSLEQYEDFGAYEVFLEARNNDNLAMSVVEEGLEHLGILISNIATIFDPDMIIIGGGIAKQGKIIFDRLKKSIKDRCCSEVAENCKIVEATLGEDSGVLGSTMLELF